MSRSHTRTVPSSPPETARRPSALTATAATRPSWLVRVCRSAPVSRSHTRTVPSRPPETARRPSALTATHHAVVAGQGAQQRATRGA